MGKNEICTDIRSFAECVCKLVSKQLGEEGQVKLQEVMKNNGVLLQGLIILTKERNLSPTIYLNPLWELYCGGTTVEQIAEKVLDIYRQEMPQESLDMSFFRDFEKVRGRICYKLVNAQKNETLLEQVPHVDVLDLSLCFYYAFENAKLGPGAILVRNDHMEMWDVSTETLMREARENTSRLYPWKLCTMGDVLKEYTGSRLDVPMYVLSNEQGFYGASCMFYPTLLQQIAERMHEDLYILPSSIHEVILMPRSEVPDAHKVQHMIREVNLTHVDPEEVLSDHLYFYQFRDNRIDIVSIYR
ncbi:MAG: hypothetical protein IJ747_05990 [Lachnospiraceae bacterium]|nr:hypothetical protein [Lachnospiraceae bacterium]